MLIPSADTIVHVEKASLSRRVNANSQRHPMDMSMDTKLIKKGEC